MKNKKNDSATRDILFDIETTLRRINPNMRLSVEQYDLASHYGYYPELDEMVTENEKLPGFIIFGDKHYSEINIPEGLFPDDIGWGVIVEDYMHYFLEPKTELTQKKKNERKAKLAI